MIERFYLDQSKEERELYVNLLEVVGSLSFLFSDSDNPFLYYRAMENIFCKAFNAENLSRGDISADAGKNGLGIGLKTFLHNTGFTSQKIAEFNKQSYILRGLEGIELIYRIAEMRNERLTSTMHMCGLSDMIYHLITRSKGFMGIYEEHMDLIHLENIRITHTRKNNIHFTDDLNEYSFSLSKNTLFKKFNTTKPKLIHGFKVDILQDPFDLLLNLKQHPEKTSTLDALVDNDVVDFIVLPLYSPKTGNVEKKSGLNQWNAAGRIRHHDEVYIPVPKWIHQVKKGFFEYNTPDNKTSSFDVKLPCGRILNMRIAQQGGKALMSNPNLALGEWILRDILGLSEKELVTKKQLDMIGIDSVKLSKKKDGLYLLDFLESGSYQDFEDEYKEL